MGDVPRSDPADDFLGEPPSDAVGEDVAMARIQGALFGESQPAKLERYALLEKLGEGTSGAVYSAWDPRLDRKVAIKVLHGGASAELEREARAMAKLAHPNVVGVHDVGESEDHLFLAMEFVDGAPLSTLDVDALGWRRVVGIYRQAASGLAAAHDVGIVHRDFKPANALLGSDGRVRVVDFGLARGGVTKQKGGSSAVHTRAAGTPLYMAPEQHRGEPVDARTDQYGFSAALWEALVGQPAFEAQSMDALANAKAQPPPIPGSGSTPARLFRVLQRGLAPEPADRFPSMRALDVALARASRGRARTLLPWVVGGVVVGGAVLLARSPGDPCVGADAVPSGWTAQARESIGDAFAKTELPHAQASGATALEVLDAWASAWGESREDACRLHAQGVQSAEGLDLRTQCLEEQRARFDAVVTVLGSADAAVVDRAVDAASALPAPSACENVERLRAAHPVSDEARERVAQATETLARARAELHAGHFERARELVAPIREQCEQGPLEHPPVCVEATRVAGRGAADAGAHDEAVRLLTRAAIEAQRARLQEPFALAAAELSWEIGELDGEFDAALTWIELGQAAIETEDAGNAEIALLNAQAAMLNNLSRWDDAAATHQRRLARLEELFGPDSPLATLSHANLANADNRRGRIEQAEAGYAKALEIAVPAFGSSHPRVLATRQNRAGMRIREGQVAQGLQELVEVFAAQQKVLGESHPMLYSALINISIARWKLGDAQGALDDAVRATAFVRAGYGDSSPMLVDTWLAEVPPLLMLGRTKEAVEVSGRAVELSRTELGAEHVSTAFALRSHGDALRTDGDEDTGLEQLAAAKAAFEVLELDDEASRTQEMIDADVKR